MWHNIKDVANNHLVNPVELLKFATSNARKYGIELNDLKEPMIGGINIDDMIKDFKNSS